MISGWCVAKFYHKNYIVRDWHADEISIKNSGENHENAEREEIEVLFLPKSIISMRFSMSRKTQAASAMVLEGRQSHHVDHGRRIFR